jgi:hypothetical protein
MAKQTVATERAEATDDRRAAAYWESVAKRDPGQTGVARGNARDLRAEARTEDHAAEQQENSPKRGGRSRRM